MKHIPNILTIIRFLFIPAIVISLIYDNYLLALILFTVSSITDVLDGKIRPTGPGTGFLGYIGNLFDISQDGGIIQLSIFVIALSVLILVFVFGIADSTYRRNRLYKKLQ